MNQLGPAYVAADSPEIERFQNQDAPVLLQYWQKVLRWKWVIIGILIGAFAIGVVSTMLMTPQYTADTRIEISREEKNITKVEGLDSPQASQDDEFYQTQYSNLAARSLAQRVVRALRLPSSEAFFAAHGVENEGGLRGKSSPVEAEGGRKAREEQAVDLLLKHLTVSPIPRSRLVDIRYTSADPNMSATIANAWAAEFIAQNVDRRFASTADARRFLEGRLSDLAQKLEESERRAVAYAAANDIVSLGNSVTPDGRTLVDRTLVSSDLEALNDALATATADRIAAQSRSGVRGPSTESVASATLSSLRQRRAEAAAHRAELLVRFEPEYPEVKAATNQIEALDAAIAREEARISGSKATSYEEAARREAELRQKVAGLKSQLSGQQAASIQYNIYKREADTNRQLYDSLLQRYKEIGVAGVAANNIAIIDRAEVPTTPSSPNLLLNIAIALIAGMGLAFLAVLILDQMDEGLGDPDAVNRLLGIPLVGTVPQTDPEDVREALANTRSELSEAYFSVYSNLTFSTSHGFPKSLMLTSSRPQEGKTTTSIALAIAAGRTGKRVLLLDCDLRSPSCHERLGLSNAKGVSNFLSGDDDWERYIQDTEYRGLSLLATGPTPPSAAELFSSERLSMLIEQAGQRFDHLIIDSAPLLGLADAPLISRFVDGVVFVIEADGVPIRGLQGALARLRQARGHILGAVVSKLESSGTRYGYGYGYHYGYGNRANEE
jgi:capsular exopolysaccharide synthesis family protein